MQRDVKVALVGAGNMGREHARAFAGLPDVTLSGIFSRSADRARKLAGDFGAAAYESVAELYRATRADLVVVTVTELAMNEISRACFAHPWTILLEKPAGYDLEDAQAIVRNAVASGAAGRTFVALNRRWYHATREALALLQQGAGAPRLVVAHDQQDLAAAREFGQPEAVVRNWMFANSIHVIDYLRVFGRGEITRVTPLVPWNPERPGHVVAQIEYSSGDRGLYQGIWDGPGPWAVSVSTSDLRLEMRPLERLTLQHRGERRLVEVPADPIDAEFKPGLRRQAEAAVVAAQGGASSLPSLEDALESMRLCARIFGKP